MDGGGGGAGKGEAKAAAGAAGRREIEVNDLVIYSEAQTPPFEIKDGITTNEEVRLKHRYLDLRRPEVQKKLFVRSKAYHIIRSFYHERQFVEVETPVLMKSTPEGARDYLVPSRVNPGKFFAGIELYCQLHHFTQDQ